MYIYIQNEYICKMNIYAKWIYLQNEYICKMNIYAKWIYMQNKYICKMNIYAKWIYMQNEDICKKLRYCFPLKNVTKTFLTFKKFFKSKINLTFSISRSYSRIDVYSVCPWID